MKHHMIKIGFGKYDYQGYLIFNINGLYQIICPEGRIHYEPTLINAKLHVDMVVDTELDRIPAPDTSIVHQLWR